MATTCCTNCGAAIESGAFCTSCGTPVAKASAPSGSNNGSPVANPSVAEPPSAYQAMNVPKQQAGATNTLAIVALITSLVGIHLAGIICGHIALNQIKASGESGRGLALAGLIIGYVGTAVVALMVIGWIIWVASLTGAQIG